MDIQELKPPLDRLARKGDARDYWEWPDRDPDYVLEFALTHDHVPSLLKLACRWGDSESLPDDNHLWAAPIHAWRALAQLGAVEVVRPLLAVQSELAERGDDWYLSEFPNVFGLVGEPSIAPLGNYLADRTKLEFPRISAADGLSKIGQLHQECRSRVVEILTAQLREHEAEQYNLNGFLVAYLLDLGAAESADIIERAFAAGVVDASVAGDWSVVCRELGVEEIGPVTVKPKSQQRSASEPRFFENTRRPIDSSNHRVKKNQKAKKAIAKLKQRRRKRRRNRNSE